MVFNLDKGRILISRFSLIRLLGEGGMGQVWHVWDGELQIDVAIKVLTPKIASSPQWIELLKNECRNTRRLNHPHIVRIFDFHRVDNLVFISMEYIDGEDLDTYRRRFGKILYKEMIPKLQPIAEALYYAHKMGLIHRDVKASNVLIDKHGISKLTDFGIASALQADKDAFHISTGGSLYCMSPQQLSGNKPHPSDDIYALGVLMYELLTGYPPFYPNITHNNIHGTVPPPVNHQLQHLDGSSPIPKHLEALITRMLAKKANERPCDMKKVSDELQNILNDVSNKTLPPRDFFLASREATSTKKQKSKIELITPLQFGKDQKNKHARGRFKNLLRVSIFLISLIAVLAGGGLLLYYLSKNPIATTSRADKDISLESKVKKNKDQKLKKTTEPAKAGAAKVLSHEKKKTEQKAVTSEKGSEQKNKLISTHAERHNTLQRNQDSKERRTALRRERKRIAEDNFQILMSSGLKAYHNHDYERARTTLLKARSLRPDSYEVQDALAQVDGAVRLVHIESFQQKALAAEQSENWEQALNAYLEVLKVDPTIQFAVHGKEKSLRLVKISKKVDFYLNYPERLESETYLNRAIRLLDETKNFEPKGNKLTFKLEKLKQLVHTAMTPVEIVFESDNLTEIIVYKVGKLGRFHVRKLKLRPGTYTVVGARNGFKDVRQKVVVKSGKNPLQISIKCSEKI